MIILLARVPSDTGVLSSGIVLFLFFPLPPPVVFGEDLSSGNMLSPTLLTPPPLAPSSIPCDVYLQCARVLCRLLVLPLSLSLSPRNTPANLPPLMSALTEREDQVPAHAPAAARAEEEVQDYLQGVASHDLLGLDSSSFAQ